MIPTLRLYRQQGEDRVAVLSTEPAHAAQGSFLIRLVRLPAGKKAKPTLATAYGPYPTPELQARWDELVAGLEAQGFSRSGALLSLPELQSASPRRRALTALRLGRARARAAVDPLKQALQSATEDQCSILDALGMIGDPRAIEAVRPFADRKLLSRRRSAVEALRALNDAVGLAEARKRALAELKDAGLADPQVGPLDGADDPGAAAGADALVKAVSALPSKQRGRATDALYEFGTARTVLAGRRLALELPLNEAFAWRYVKSVLKRALLRGDHETVARVARRIETTQVHAGAGSVKSGKDGETRYTSIFGPNTRRWLLRAVWRHLRALARWRPAEYPRAAAEVLVAYGPEDARAPKGAFGEYAHCHLLHQVLWGGGQRVRPNRSLRWRTLKHSVATPRQERYPELWDARPLAYLRLLAAARLPLVQEFAARAVAERHFDLLHEARTDELVAMLQAPLEKTVELGAQELAKRWDPKQPDWDLLASLLDAAQDRPRDVGLAWLRAAAPAWAREPARALALLGHAHAEVRSVAGELLAHEAQGLDAAARRALAEGVLAALQAPEKVEGAHAPYAQVAREALGVELDVLLALDAALALVEKGSVSAKTVAGHVLGRKPGALEKLGLARVLALAEHEVAAVRGAAHAMLQGAIEALKLEPGPLFVLSESPWEDTRKVAFDLIKQHLDFAAFGPEQRLDALLLLCDSTRPDVQAFGRELVLTYFRDVDPRQVMARLAEHPHPGMRRFALDLIEDHLPPGPEALESVTRFFLAALLDVRPDRRVKRQAVDYLVRRGLLDFPQARVAAGILDAWVRTSVRADRERALEALARLKLEFPDLSTIVEVRG